MLFDLHYRAGPVLLYTSVVMFHGFPVSCADTPIVEPNIQVDFRSRPVDTEIVYAANSLMFHVPVSTGHPSTEAAVVGQSI
ncbi:hypothetical protein V5799_032975 [Amblyomma americanum]|uniref:Uncharacterized protein n=1 Tax=Amblyomma americanum TaxID=6943 RepID=A0AAQ4DPM4_AMBAM